jgi:hypothetical protein
MTYTRQTKAWAVIQFKHANGEWTGHIRFADPNRKAAAERLATIQAEEDLGPSELVLRKIVVSTPQMPVIELIRQAATVQEVRDILVEARLKMYPSTRTKRLWEAAASARELALNRAATAGPALVTLDEGVLKIGGPGIVKADGSPVTR